MINLLSETLETLAEHGKSPDDVRWCGSPKFGAFPWEVFTRLADVEYDNGFGAAHVAGDLVIVGEGWWMERGEYDGSEWWDFQQPIERPAERIPVRLIGGLWEDLTRLNSPEWTDD